MKRTRTHLFRRAVKWTAGFVLVVSMAAWVVSLWGISCNSRSGPMWLLERGDVAVHNVGGLFRSGFEVGELRTPRWSWPQIQSWPAMSAWALTVPLWIPAILSGAVFICLWRVDQRAAAQARQALCPTCAYDLTGITGPCPECGREENRR